VKRLSILTVCSMMLWVGCGDDFAAPSLVSNLRLLAVQADKPFARPGEEVKLSALAHDPEQRVLSWGWGTCIDDGSSLALDCLRKSSFESLTIAEGRSEHTVVVPSEASTYLGVVVMVCPGRIERGDTYGIPLSCVDEAGRALPPADYELGIKRVFVRNDARNANPAIAELRFDGAPWAEDEVKVSSCERTENMRCVSWQEHELALSAPGAEEQSVDRAGVPIRELAVAQLYATGGEFEHEALTIERLRTTFRAREEDSGELLTLWFVVRDDRGGVSWTSRKLRVP
jgi:hypothetical protein